MKPNLPIKYGGSMCGDEEFQAVTDSIHKSITTGNWQAGEEAKKMEEECCKFLGVKYGVLTNSGSSAGLLALSALELPAGSEVIISACTFPTIFNIILQCNLVPVVVDAKPGTYNFDYKDVLNAITKRTRAIIAVHAVGNPCDMRALVSMCTGRKIKIIEDNCDGWGSTIGGKKVGSFGDVSITSFHAAHIVSMGVGGGVFTNNKVYAKNIRMYRDWGRQADISGKSKHGNLPKDYDPRFVYEKIGYNFQILELQAAMGRIQLRKSDEIKRLRKENFDYLYKHLAKYPKLILPQWNPLSDVCWFAFPITVTERGLRKELVKHLTKNQIETRSMFAGDITRHPAYSKIKYKVSGLLQGANTILHDSFWISVHPRLTQADREYIIKTFDDFFDEKA